MATNGIPISTQMFVVLLLAYHISSLSFEFRSSQTYGCEAHWGTYVHTDQWIFGHFLAPGDHNIRVFVLNSVLTIKSIDSFHLGVTK